MDILKRNQWFSNINPKHFFGLIVAYQLIWIFQGIDLSDEGFLATFYQNIFTHPESVQYNFMFWLTGVIGGIWWKFFPFLGILGLRLAGIIVVTSTAYTTYLILKKHISASILLIGIFLVIINLNNDIKTINYNNLSALFFVIVILLLAKHLENPKTGYLFLVGLLLSLNIMVRLPNILGLSLCSLPLLAPGSLEKKSKAFFEMILGILIGFFFIYLMLRSTGQMDTFFNAFQLVREMSQAKTQNGIVGGNYGFMKILVQFRSDILHSLLYTMLILGLTLAIQLSFAGYIRNSKMRHWSSMALTTLLLIVVIAMILQGNMRYFSSLPLYHGAGIISTLIILHRRMPLAIQYISFAGLLTLLFYPVGSAQGILTAGKFCLWISTPIALDILYKGIVIKPNQYFAKKLPIITVGQNSLPEWSIIAVRKSFLVTVVAFGLFFSFRYPMFDYGSRFEMWHTIENKNLAGIGTTKSRSEAINNLLAASRNIIKPGDTLLAYDCMPLLHFLTETTPFLHNSYPWLYSTGAFEKDLETCSSRSTHQPVLIRQKIQTIGDGGGWPSEIVSGKYEDWEVNKGRNEILNRFLIEHGYTLYWESPYFQIMVPKDFRLPRG